MSLDHITLLAILLMALATLLTRTAGLLLVGRFRPSGRGKAAFDAIPPAILTAVIAPAVLTSGPAEAIAGLITAVAAFRLPLLGTVLVGVAAIVVLRSIIGA
jgi:branched chain amino acid efflux pump